MKKTLIAATVLLSGFSVAGASCGDKITPAKAELQGCETYAAVLTSLIKPREDGKFNKDILNIIDTTRATLDPLCLGPAPDVNSTVKDVVVDAGVTSLQAVASSLLK